MKNSIVPIALEYYDREKDRYNKLFSKVRYVKIDESTKDISHNVINMFDSNKNKIYSSEYEVLGLYVSDTDTWLWGWTVPYFRKNSINISKKILNYGIELDPDTEFLKTELITSRFKINDPIQLDIHTAIGSYLAKNPIIFEFKNFSHTRIDDNYIDIVKSKLEENEQSEQIEDSYIIYYLYILQDNIKK